jgi:hypothetical protein
MKHNTIDKGIINLTDNPFVHESWVQQNYGFTEKRQSQIENLFDESIENILMNQPDNVNRYVAFAAIRWGFAIVKDGELTPTEKWTNRFHYDGHGQPLKQI